MARKEERARRFVSFLLREGRGEYHVADDRDADAAGSGTGAGG
jgi:hypothetical protein